MSAENNEMAIDLNNLDKSNWKTYRFDEIAKNISERVDPKKTDLTVYIGLEHLDSGSIHIKRHGTPGDVNGQKLKFYKGDVIFGRRRAYQRKAGIATTDGFCSAHALVLRANPDVIRPELFPFFLHSDLFMNRAIDISVGSLSPTINWGTLKHQEFQMPPLESQLELANLFNYLDASIQNEVRLNSQLTIILESQIESLIHNEPMDGFTINQVLKSVEKKQKVGSLKSLGTIFKGKGISKSEVKEDGIPCIRYGELYTNHQRIIRSPRSFVNQASADKSIKIKANDVLFAGSGETISEIGKSASYISEKEAYAGSDILVFRPFDMDGCYAGYLMNSKLVRHQLNKLGTGATVMHVYGTDIEKIIVPVHSREQQVEISSKLENIYEKVELTKSKISKSKELQSLIINRTF